MSNQRLVKFSYFRNRKSTLFVCFFVYFVFCIEFDLLASPLIDRPAIDAKPFLTELVNFPAKWNQSTWRKPSSLDRMLTISLGEPHSAFVGLMAPINERHLIITANLTGNIYFL